MSYEKIVERRVVKNDRLLYSRNIAARTWYVADEYAALAATTRHELRTTTDVFL